MESEPFTWADLVQDHVTWDLEQDDTEREHLLADCEDVSWGHVREYLLGLTVELVLVDTDILHETVRDGIGDVTSVQF